MTWRAGPALDLTAELVWQDEEGANVCVRFEVGSDCGVACPGEGCRLFADVGYVCRTTALRRHLCNCLRAWVNGAAPAPAATQARPATGGGPSIAPYGSAGPPRHDRAGSGPGLPGPHRRYGTGPVPADGTAGPVLADGV